MIYGHCFDEICHTIERMMLRAMPNMLGQIEIPIIETKNKIETTQSYDSYM